MANWNYSEQEYKESKITIPAGKHRVRFASITPKISKTSGNQMYEIVFDVSNYAFKIYYYLVFAPDNTSRVNGSLGAIRDSFGVNPSVDPEVTPPGWVGAVGAANVKLDEEGKPKISYFIEKDKQTDLPAWIEKSTPQQSPPIGGYNPNSGPIYQTEPPYFPDADVVAVDDTSLPFDL